MKRLIKALSSLKSQQTRNMRTTIVPRVTVFKEPPYLSFIPTDSTLAMPYLYFIPTDSILAMPYLYSIPTDTTPAMRVRQGCKKFTRFVNLKLTILRAIHIQLQKSRKCRHVKGRKQTTFTTLPRQMTMFVLWQRLKIQTQIFIHTFNINDLRTDHVLRLTHSIRYCIEEIQIWVGLYSYPLGYMASFVLYYVFSSLFHNQTHIIFIIATRMETFQQHELVFKATAAYLAPQLVQLRSLGLQEGLRLSQDLQVVILRARCRLDVFLQLLQPTSTSSTRANRQGDRAPGAPAQHKPTKPGRGRTYSSVSFSFFVFKHWKSESFAATTLFISFKISSCSVLCCSKSFVSACNNLKHIALFPPDSLDLTCYLS